MALADARVLENSQGPSWSFLEQTQIARNGERIKGESFNAPRAVVPPTAMSHAEQVAIMNPDATIDNSKEPCIHINFMVHQAATLFMRILTSWPIITTLASCTLFWRR